MKQNRNKFAEQTFGNIFLSKLLKLDWIIILCVILLGFVGVASLYSAAGGDWEPWAKNHLMRLIFGSFLMLILAFLPPNIFFKFSILSFFLGIITLVLVKFIGTGNVQRWITINGINFQPSEFMKLGLILILARYFDHVSRIELDKLMTYLVPIFLIFIPGFLVISQPDLGTSVLIALSGIIVLWLAGLNVKYFASN